ncbi:MAG: metallophosphoesterase [Pseudomonadota bacterium]
MSPALPLLLLLLPARADLVSGPWVQAVSTGEAWVLWEGEPTGLVEWGPAGDPTRTAGVTETSGAIQQARLQPLDPGTRYSYRVVDGVSTSDTATFRSARAGRDASFTFAVVSDTQHDHGHPGVWQETVEEGIIPWCLDHYGQQDIDQVLDFVLVVGDLVDNGWEEEQWREELIAPAQPLMAAVPFYAAIGNHEANSPDYFDRFHLPDNGSADYPEHWWYLDRANMRLLGLDSNAPYTGTPQLEWLDGVLADACADDRIDMVFAAMHHPFKSELWPPGESAFTGEVIARLDTFALDCEKPAAHLFGHTHGYARGQSRDAPHAWVNVATGWGNIDHWGEYDQHDYDEFVTSLDEYGFVVVDVNAGDDPGFTIRRLGRGDEDSPGANAERDLLQVRRFPSHPATPEARSPAAAVQPWCIPLAASPYCDFEGDLHGAAYWQVAADREGFDTPLWESWEQHQDLYGDVDLRAGDDLRDTVIPALEPERSYRWRVRYRDRGLAWSRWSTPTAFETEASGLSDNLLQNPGAEQGTAGWEAIDGPLEALATGECDGGEPHAGAAYFAVGGVCEAGVDAAEAVQRVDLTAWADAIDEGALNLLFGGWVASYEGHDLAEIELRFLDGDGAELGRSERLGEPSATWVQLRGVVAVPAGTRAVDFALLGTRSAGQDCDAYLDDLELRADDQGVLTACLVPPPYPWPEEAVSCLAPEDSAEPGDSAEPSRRCGCASGARAPAFLLPLLALVGLRRRRYGSNR